jgi:hypothetical protein
LRPVATMVGNDATCTFDLHPPSSGCGRH